jgi:AbrB family looped-hinge helix DNA binding protein
MLATENLIYKIGLTYLTNKIEVEIMGIEMFEMGSISSRGQVAIPSEIRKQMGLEDGSKVLFFLNDDMLIMKKVTRQSFSEVTRPLKEAAKASGLRESDVNDIVHRFRKR